MLDVDYSSKARKFMKKADKILNSRLLEKIETLRVTPFTHDTKTVEGYKEKVFRVRIGKYRILYEVDYKNNKIGIVNIDKRPRAYD